MQEPTKVSFVRCARTDKGVHASANLVSLKMIIEDDKIIEKINSYLPEQIRVWNFVRTRNNFHAKNACDSRIYEYLLPTYSLIKCDGTLYPYSAVAIDEGVDPSEVYKIRNRFEVIEVSQDSKEQVLKRREYRIDNTALNTLRMILKKFEGTKNQHNFTVGKTFADSSSKRYILSFTVFNIVIVGWRTVCN
jgi:tRNA pseudouridine38-40 synthase